MYRWLPLLLTLVVAFPACGDTDGTGLGRTTRLQISGVVTDGNTQHPIVGAEVDLRRKGVGAGTLLRGVVTDAEGRFSMTHTEPSCARMLVMYVSATGYEVGSAGALQDGLTIECTEAVQAFDFVLQPVP